MTTVAQPPGSIGPEGPQEHFGRNLKRIRLRQYRSQSELASLIRRVGREIGEPNECSKRLVQKWESGGHGSCRPNYRRLLLVALGVSYEHLCEPWPEMEPEPDVLLEAESLREAMRTMNIALDHVIDELADFKRESEATRRQKRIRSYKIRRRI